MRPYRFLFTLALVCSAAAQGLFESAGEAIDDSTTSTTRKKTVDLSGYVRSALFTGQSSEKDAVVKAAYGEVSCKISAEKNSIGRAFAEIRVSPGTGYGPADHHPDVREAWVAVSPGPFDLTIGKKIIAWGRADGINPTNTVTPMDETAFSSEYDDTRLGTVLADMSCHLRPLTFQAIWLPYYTPDVLPIKGAELPDGVTLAGTAYPDATLDNSGFALRCDLSLPSLDGSVSYCNSYTTQPGFDYRFSTAGITLTPTAFRAHTIGADFSTAVGPYGIRGEGALTIPFDDPDKAPFIPARHGAYVFGLDRTIADWSVLVQYSGVHIFGFTTLPEPSLSDPSNPLALQAYMMAAGDAEMRRVNRLFTGTADRTSHAVTGRIGWRGMYETLRIELAGLYNFTTREYAANPSIAYDIADAFCITAGGRYLRGPDESLNALIDDMLSCVYTELKLSF